MSGFLKKFLRFFRVLKMDKEIIKEQKRCLKMSTEELKSLDDDELFTTVLNRLEYKVDKYGDMIAGIRSLTGVKRVFYVASYYETEVNNGGLCQFFVNSSREFAPELSACLGAIGAEDHKKLFDTFIADNKINVNDLSSFIINDTDEFKAQEKRYPFDEFDDAFFALKTIEEYLIDYIKEHISEF